jgi:predicted phage tail protein
LQRTAEPPRDGLAWAMLLYRVRISRTRKEAVMDKAKQMAISEEVTAIERQEALARLAQEGHERLLRIIAGAAIVAIFGLVPIAGLAGMYYMGGAVLAPLCLAGGVLLIGGISYRMLSWMMIEAERVDRRPPATAIERTVQPAVSIREKEPAELVS